MCFLPSMGGVRHFAKYFGAAEFSRCSTLRTTPPSCAIDPGCPPEHPKEATIMPVNGSLLMDSPWKENMMTTAIRYNSIHMSAATRAASDLIKQDAKFGL